MPLYSPGTDYGIVTPHGSAYLPGTLPPAVALAVHDALADRSGLGPVLEALAAASGSSLLSLPPFAVVVSDEHGLRAAVRGGIELVVAGEPAFSGDRATTWIERLLPAAAEVELRGAASASVDLPLVDGIVLASRIGGTAAVELPAEAEAESASRVASGAAAEPSRGDAIVDPWPPSPPPAALVTVVPVAVSPDTLLDAGADTLLDPEAPHERESESESDRDAEESDGVPVDPAVAEYDRILYEDTVMSSVEAAAVREPLIDGIAPPPPPPVVAPAPAGTSSVPTVAGDHDGETLSIEQLRLLGVADPLEEAPVAVPTGVARPVGTLRLSTGETYPLDRGAIVGRRPRVHRAQGGLVPHLVTVPSPTKHISSSHVELRLEGASVLAVDLDATNGTLLRRGSAPPIRLLPQDATLLVSGDVLDLGDGTTVTVEGLG